MVLMLVITTDKATSPLAISVTTLLAVPPGQQPTRIKPTAKGAGSCNNTAMAAAKLGITRNWAATPRITARGCRLTRRKSRGVRPRPIPNMITPKPMVISGPRNQTNKGGCSNASRDPSSVQSGNSVVNRSRDITGQRNTHPDRR